MCDRPIMIDNPYLGLKHVGLNRFHDCTSSKIPVPCGHCHTCIALRQNYYIQRCQMESLGNHLFMMTLTYRQTQLRFKMVNGRKLYYADFTDVQKMFKRLRNRGLKFRYIVVSEYGGKNHRPHFHALISVPKQPKDTFHDVLNLERKLSDMFLGEWRRNYGSDKKPLYKSLCQLVITPYGRTYDFHYVNPSLTLHGEADVAFYVTKYVLKADDWVDRLKSALKLNLSPDDFQDVWKLLKPRVCISKGFGDYESKDVQSHIAKGIVLAILDKATYPYFINPVTGNTFPLARTYQKRFLGVDDKIEFMRNSPFEDGYCETETINLMRSSVDDKRLSKIRDKVNARLTNYDICYDTEDKNILPAEVEITTNSITSVADDWSDSYHDFGLNNQD